MKTRITKTDVKFFAAMIAVCAAFIGLINVYQHWKIVNQETIAERAYTKKHMSAPGYVIPPVTEHELNGGYVPREENPGPIHWMEQDI